MTGMLGGLSAFLHGSPQSPTDGIDNPLENANVRIPQAKRVLDGIAHALDVGQDASGKRHRRNFERATLDVAHAFDQEPHQVGEISSALLKNFLRDLIAAIGACHYLARELGAIPWRRL